MSVPLLCSRSEPSHKIAFTLAAGQSVVDMFISFMYQSKMLELLQPVQVLRGNPTVHSDRSPQQRSSHQPPRAAHRTNTDSYCADVDAPGASSCEDFAARRQ